MKGATLAASRQQTFLPPKDELAALLATGVNAIALAKHYGVRVQDAIRWVFNYDLSFNPGVVSTGRPHRLLTRSGKKKRNPPVEFDAPPKETLLALVDRGLTRHNVAEHYGVPLWVVHRWQKLHDVKFVRQGWGLNDPTKAERRKFRISTTLRMRYRELKDYGEIATTLGVTRSHVQQIAVQSLVEGYRDAEVERLMELRSRNNRKRRQK
jgi:hypothetical protein